MEKAVYEIVSRGEEFFVLHDGNEAGPYLSKEAAFEASIGPARLSFEDNLEVIIRIEGGASLHTSP